MLPSEFPPYTAVQHYYYAWRDDGRWQTINHVLLMAARKAEGRDPSPSAGIIDSQSVKTTEAFALLSWLASILVPDVATWFLSYARAAAELNLPARVLAWWFIE